MRLCRCCRCCLLLTRAAEEAPSKKSTTLRSGGGCRGGRGVRGREEQGEQGLEETKFLLVSGWGGCRRGFSPKKAGDAIDDWPGFWCGSDPQHLLDFAD